MNPERYLGIPWMTGGRDVANGLDCWGLLCHIYKDAYGLEIPAYNVPAGTLANPDDISQGELFSHCWLELVSPEPGDVVILGRLNRFTHVGVYVETPAPSIIHSAKGCLSAIVSLRLLTRYGYTKTKFYRHVDRDFC